jgi:hypothetical protein
MTNRVYLLYLLLWQWLFSAVSQASPCISCHFLSVLLANYTSCQNTGLPRRTFYLYLVWPTSYFISWFEQFCPLYAVLTNLFICILVWLIYSPASCSYEPSVSMCTLYQPTYCSIPLPTNLRIFNWPTYSSVTCTPTVSISVPLYKPIYSSAPCTSQPASQPDIYIFPVANNFSPWLYHVLANIFICIQAWSVYFLCILHSNAVLPSSLITPLGCQLRRTIINIPMFTDVINSWHLFGLAVLSIFDIWLLV